MVASHDKTLFTIGHSTHEMPDFLALLHRHRVTAVADVRSQPTSRLLHFERQRLTDALRAAGIRYVFLGDELGARRSEPECYIDDRADYERIPALPAFQAGLVRLRKGLEKHRICLLCAEKEPLDCHRSILICRQLREGELSIQHILADGTLESHATTEQRLVKLTGIERDLFEPDLTDAEILSRAYEARGKEIAFDRAKAEGAVR